MNIGCGEGDSAHGFRGERLEDDNCHLEYGRLPWEYLSHLVGLQC